MDGCSQAKARLRTILGVCRTEGGQPDRAGLDEEAGQKCTKIVFFKGFFLAGFELKLLTEKKPNPADFFLLLLGTNQVNLPACWTLPRTPPPESLRKPLSGSDCPGVGKICMN